jgi:hypothetical protein
LVGILPAASARCAKVTSHRMCKFSQNSGDVPKTFASRNAVLAADHFCLPTIVGTIPCRQKHRRFRTTRRVNGSACPRAHQVVWSDAGACDLRHRPKGSNLITLHRNVAKSHRQYRCTKRPKRNSTSGYFSLPRAISLPPRKRYPTLPAIPQPRFCKMVNISSN